MYPACPSNLCCAYQVQLCLWITQPHHANDVLTHLWRFPAVTVAWTMHRTAAARPASARHRVSGLSDSSSVYGVHNSLRHLSLPLSALSSCAEPWFTSANPSSSNSCSPFVAEAVVRARKSLRCVAPITRATAIVNTDTEAEAVTASSSTGQSPAMSSVPSMLRPSETDTEPAANWELEIEELLKLTQLLPPAVRVSLEQHPEQLELLEVRLASSGGKAVASVKDSVMKLLMAPHTDAGAACMVSCHGPASCNLAP